MAFIYKTLGQVAPSSTSETAAYTVPASTSAIVSAIVVCNTSASAATFRVHQRIAGATAATNNALYYDVSLAAKTTITLENKITLAAGDVLGVQSGTANSLTFTIEGTEVTA